MSLKSKRITHRILDNEHFPVIRPSAYGRIARLDHAIRLLEEDGNGVGIPVRIVVVGADVTGGGVTTAPPAVLGRRLPVVPGRRRRHVVVAGIVGGLVVVVIVAIDALVAAFRRHCARNEKGGDLAARGVVALRCSLFSIRNTTRDE